MFFLVSVLRLTLFVLIPISAILTTYLYLYPVFHLCSFPSPARNPRNEYLQALRQHTPFAVYGDDKVAPFRLLALGDPQLEGDSSIPYVESTTLPHLRRLARLATWQEPADNPLQRLKQGLHDVVDFWLDDIPKAAEVYRKRIDHIGNDYYLGHIYRTLYWWSDPTHVTVLGDLVGSQWIDDQEFERRAWRFWNRVFRGGVKVGEELAFQSGEPEEFQGMLTFGDDAAAWKKRIINVAGNHDVGYAGDLSQDRMARFTRLFGKANYELRFQLPQNQSTKEMEVDGEWRAPPELRIVVLNDMNLDTPAGDTDMQAETYNFLNKVITESHDVTRPAHFTLVLTHIPLFKREGICVDGPFFDFFDGEFENGVKEQNHLSAAASKGFLEGIFGMNENPSAPGGGFGRNGVILTGHDHEGCDIYHYINHTAPPKREWEAQTYISALANNLPDKPMPGLREITVRSMMGDFAGNAGLMSLWFDEEEWDWKFEFVNCGLGTQHIWWLAHILDLVSVVGLFIYWWLRLWIDYVDAYRTPEEGETVVARAWWEQTPNSGKMIQAKRTSSARINGSGRGNGDAQLRKRKSKVSLGEKTNSRVVSSTL